MNVSVQKIELAELNIPMLDLLTPDEQFRFCRRAQKKQYSFQHQVYKQGEMPTDLYYIVSGEFKKVGFKGMPLGFLEVGCIFGDDEIIDSMPRRYSVICNSAEGVVYIFKKELFEDIFMTNPEIVRKIKELKRNRN